MNEEAASGGEERSMNWLYLVGALVAGGLFLYLAVALFKPELFE